ncbi:uncharacterized protein PHACADRAFT_185451 [Phanerochaete carnosa HHB-10118-sp]|uniref:Uncharacterized protein n=1 Tax=Phanerochaete carnosa (strain HHB-10118-sp) TaxID=650164 RepID=K5WVQ3_PHACS|nr:uncharacterized protein PHACADRAFT_185451 [Phanerochaete carnosa HHB-10118-sp]EKM54532.1 hypothetical protein PHACADRAFT_185451 [Phanerochaete carnosa HHB-10118-sp]
MYLITSAASALLLGQLIHASPLLHPRQLPIVDEITCNIAGVQIANPAQTLAGVQSGAIQAPSGFTTAQFGQLLVGCLRRGATDNFRRPQLPTEFTNGGETSDVSENGDPSVAGNYPVFSGFSTGNLADPASIPANGGPPSDPPASNAAADNTSGATVDSTNNVASTDPPAANNNGDSNATPAAGTAPTDPPVSDSSATDASSSNAPAADPPASDPAAADPGTTNNDVAAVDSNAASSTSDPPADPPASPANGGSGDDGGDSTSASASFNPDRDESFNPDGSLAGSSSDGSSDPGTSAGTDAASSGGDAGNASPAAASTDPAASANGANADGTASPFLSYDTDAAPDTAGADPASRNSFNLVNSHHTTANGAGGCDGMLCLADVVLPAGIAEAPELGLNGLKNGNPGGCPNGDIDACVDLGTR